MRSSSEGGFVKVFNQVYPDAFAAMLEAAGEAGVDVVGHRPRAVAAIDASAAGMRSFEHARLFLFECFDGTDDLRRNYLAQFNGEGDGGRLDDTAGLQAMLDGHDPAMCDALIDTMVANGTWFCPTHVTRRMDALAGDADFRGDPRLAYIRRLQRFEWNRDADEMLERYPGAEGHATVTAFYEKGLELTGKAHRAGVKILAGSDASDTHCFPGFSLHDELKELVKAGLSPLNALRAATLNGAEYARATADHGSVTPGKFADLVLIEGNPLDDIANTSRIRAVIFDGVVYDRPTLDAMLDDVKGHASSLPLAARELRSNMSP
jgi:hypothetical protein